MDIEFEPINGKYFALDVDGTSHRIYMEESGSGIPLVCLHTAGSDARQFRHILCDKDITSQFWVIAFDMPWHGKSNPPENFHATEYKLTVDGYKSVVKSFIAAMGLDKPVVLGCSMGGRIVCHLAIDNPVNYRAMIALEGADNLSPYYDLDWLHRPDVHGGEIQAAFVSSQLAPQSPSHFRHETLWHYMQGGPGIFKGDLHFYWLDGDFEKVSGNIDTDLCPIYLMSGEYDCSCTPERMFATAERIKGSKAILMEGLGHFPMSENPALFKQYLMPVLAEIAAG